MKERKESKFEVSRIDDGNDGKTEGEEWKERKRDR